MRLNEIVALLQKREPGGPLGIVRRFGGCQPAKLLAQAADLAHVLNKLRFDLLKLRHFVGMGRRSRHSRVVFGLERHELLGPLAPRTGRVAGLRIKDGLGAGG